MRMVLIAVTVTMLAGCGESSSPLVAHGEFEAACGECQFEMEGDGCNLAVRIKGQAYFVDGTGIDDHGDAHAADGLCNSIRMARIKGKVVDGRFVAEEFALLDENE